VQGFPHKPEDALKDFDRSILKQMKTILPSRVRSDS